MISHEETVGTGPPLSLAQRRAFLKLPIEERRRAMAEQAEQMAEHSESESERVEREQWQGGDIVEY